MKFCLVLLSAFLCFTLYGRGNLPASKILSPLKYENKRQVTFTENKGQICDQQYKHRPDVLFGGSAPGMVFHLRIDGVSYQLNRTESSKENSCFSFSGLIDNYTMKPVETTVYRLDINWLNTKKDFSVIPDNALPGVSHYYQTVCPSGIHNIRTYTGVTYKAIYNGIDLHYYNEDGSLKYDYIVAPNADYRQIQFRIDGADEIILQQDGSVLIRTPLGDITEGAPVVYQNGRTLNSYWKFENNILSYEIKNRDPMLEMIIDPVVRVWGTYYGDNAADHAMGCALDSAGNVFISGGTSSATNIATTGSHQATLSLFADAYAVKFNSSGVRQWSTYYGGNDTDGAHSCTTDAFGNLIIAGYTRSTDNAIASSGCHQGVYGGGGGDGFLAKFNSNGIRQWGSYYGGNGLDYVYSCRTDLSGNVFISGDTRSTNNIATPGSHLSAGNYSNGSPEAFVVKFNASGQRQWGTYYGSPNAETDARISVDNAGNVFMCATTQYGLQFGPPSPMITTGCHQAVYGGGSEDIILVKFNNAGVRQWATFYGGSKNEYVATCANDSAGNVYLAGSSTSTAAIATSGSHQQFLSAASDVFLVKFNSNGIRQWATYYGGSGGEHAYCITDQADNCYLIGHTNSGNGNSVATPGSYQPTIGGSTDVFLAKFNGAGVRQWGTYYGGPDNEIGYAMAVTTPGALYVAGSTRSDTVMANLGAHQPGFGGGLQDAFLAKFSECSGQAPTDVTPATNLARCVNQTATLSVIGPASVNWYGTATGTLILGTGAQYITPTLTAGTYTFFAEDASCAPSEIRTAITVTVHPQPLISVNSGAICSGHSFTLSPTGANSYTFTGGSNIVTPIATSNYSVYGTSSAGCISTSPAISTVTVHSLPTIKALSDASVICLDEQVLMTSSGAYSYSWSNGANTFSTLVAPKINTTYTVVGTDTNGCENTAAITVTVSECIGLLEPGGMKASVYLFPNPNSGHFYLEVSGESRVLVYNALGETILNSLLLAGKNLINLKNAAAGIYLVQVNKVFIKMILE